MLGNAYHDFVCKIKSLTHDPPSPDFYLLMVRGWFTGR